MSKSTIELQQSNEAHQPLLQQHDVSGSVMKLEWSVIEGHFGNWWQSILPGFKSNYTIYYDHNRHSWFTSGLSHEKTRHNNPDEAKEWCQKDFESKVMTLITTDR